MVTQHGHEAPRDARGASSWLLRFYDDTGAHVAAWCRLAALVWSLVTGVAAVCAPFYGWRVAVAALLALAFTALYGWVGYFYLANPEWKDGAPDGDA